MRYNYIDSYSKVATSIIRNEILRWLNGDTPRLVGISIIAHDLERDHVGRCKEFVQGVRPAREIVSRQKLGCLVE
jgi:hypothetical protein